jgi:hypothetical protein
MLSAEVDDLAVLILARQTLIARAMELDEANEALIALHEAPFDRIRPSAETEQSISARFEKITAELDLVPALLASLDERIARA